MSDKPIPKTVRTPHTPPGQSETNAKAIVDRAMDPYGEHAAMGTLRKERDRDGK